MMFLDCPAYLDEDGAVRCGLPAEVRGWFTMASTDGPLESAMIRCPAGHWFNGPIEFLTRQDSHKRDPGRAAAPSPTRDRLTGSHAGLDGSGASAAGDVLREPRRASSRPNSAPAYYLGRPARLWISVTNQRHQPSRPVALRK